MSWITDFFDKMCGKKPALILPQGGHAMVSKALLVGINQYPNGCQLAGCLNDVENMRAELLAYGFKASEIVVLKDREATTANILAKLNWLVDVPTGSRVMFHYSGHGAQLPSNDPSEPDHLSECICFTGDTKIPLLDGSEKTLYELAQNGKPVWVYSVNKFGDIVHGLAIQPRMTSRNARVLRIELDNGESVRCTPDHLWMLRDGTYRKAKHLKSGDSLMPLYRTYRKHKNRKKYELHMNVKTNKYVLTHKTTSGICPTSIKERAEEQGCGVVVHHENYNSLDNSPENLRWMTWKDHSSMHTQTEEFKAEQSAMHKRLWSDPVYRQRMCERQSIAAKVRWQNPEYRKKISEASKQQDLSSMRAGASKYISTLTEEQKQERGRKAGLANKGLRKPASYVALMKKRWEDPEYRARMSESLRASAKRRWEDPEYRKQMSEMSRQKHAAPINHKVVSITEAGTADVYDISVPEYENFAISAGVFVHNCPVDFCWKPQYAIIDKQFVQIFSKIPSGCVFNWLSDSCHSGDLSRELLGPPPSYWTRFRKFSMFWKRPPIEKPKHFPMPAAVLNEIRRFKMKGASCRAMVGGLLDVGFVSGCLSTQTSADTAMDGKPCGAATWFFLKNLRKNRNLPLAQLVEIVRKDLAANGYEQRPQAEGARINRVFLA